VHFSSQYAIWWQDTLSVYNMQLRNIGKAKFIVCPRNPTVARATPNLPIKFPRPYAADSAINCIHMFKFVI